MMKQTRSYSRTWRSPVCLLRWLYFALAVPLLITGCTPQPRLSPQPSPSGVETTAPVVTEPLLPASATLTNTAPPSPSTVPTSTPEPTQTPTSTPEPTTIPTVLPTGTGVPTQSPAATSLTSSGMVTFQIRNATDKVMYVFGYGMDKSIPSGLTVYFQAPDWGEISLRICHKNKEGELGGCYIYTGNISISKPLIEITK